MPVIAAAQGTNALPRRGALISALVALIAVLAILLLNRPDVMDGVRNAFNQGAATVGRGVSQGVNDVKSLASMFTDRSPGARLEALLAVTKDREQPPLHQRALAKLRQPGTAGAPPFASLIAPPPGTTLPPPPAPLYNVVTGPPALIAQGGPPLGVPGGPSFVGGAPPGGGGGIAVPPSPVPQIAPPPPPGTPAVPEPSSWAMMLLGLALMGRMLRRGDAGSDSIEAPPF